MGAALARISIGLLFVRMLGSTARIWRVGIYALICVIGIVNLVFSLLLEVECMPLQKLWNPRVKGSCWSDMARTDLDYVQGVFAVTSSFFLAALPLLLARQLNLGGNKKWPMIAFGVLSVRLVSPLATMTVCCSMDTDESQSIALDVSPSVAQSSFREAGAASIPSTPFAPCFLQCMPSPRIPGSVVS
jgi:hypothetical protein